MADKDIANGSSTEDQGSPPSWAAGSNPEDRFISTGRLPDFDRVRDLIEEALERFRDHDAGAVSNVYPALARMPADQFGICFVTSNGKVHEAGSVATPFSLMSVSKPFVFALVCEHLGADAIRKAVGVNATGRSFNSLAAIEANPEGRTNPMVNPGAIVTTSLAAGSGEDRWQWILQGLSRFAGRRLELDEEILACARETNHRNRAAAQFLHGLGHISGDPDLAVDHYTRQCSLRVTARDLAVMAATLADGGVNPISGEHVVSMDACHHTLAVMITAGLYENSGEWLYQVGLPGKSGISGGMVTVSPGKGGLGTFSPRLDGAGNSVRGQLVSRFLSQQLGLDLLVSAPST